MSINILYFASLREQIGRASDVIEITDSMRVIDAWQQTTGLSDDLLGNLLVAVNQEYTTVDALLKDGDELAFFPPVTGG